MKFMVIRTSQGYSGDTPPCKGAVREAYVRVDERTASDPAKIAHYGDTTDWWYGEGTNHRVERRHIKRDFPDEAWFIEVPDLAALMALEKREGDLILRRALFNPGIPCIEIYDGYRE